MIDPPPAPLADRPAEPWRSWVLDWSQIDAPGCYLHLPTGLLARVFSPSEAPARDAGAGTSGAAVRLSSDPHTPLDRLREIAMQHTLPVAF